MAKTMEKKYAYRRIYPSIPFRRLASKSVRFQQFNRGGSLGVREPSICPVQQIESVEIDQVSVGLLARGSRQRERKNVVLGSQEFNIPGMLILVGWRVERAFARSCAWAGPHGYGLRACEPPSSYGCQANYDEQQQGNTNPPGQPYGSTKGTASSGSCIASPPKRHSPSAQKCKRRLFRLRTSTEDLFLQIWGTRPPRAVPLPPGLIKTRCCASHRRTQQRRVSQPLLDRHPSRLRGVLATLRLLAEQLFCEPFS